MSGPIFRITPEAVQEAIHAARWYRERSFGAAERFLSELNQVLDRVIAAPYRWPRGFAGTRKVKLPTFPFLVVYRATEKSVLVVAVVHGRRKPNYWKDRL